jgi:hypothetical protein
MSETVRPRRTIYEIIRPKSLEGIAVINPGRWLPLGHDSVVVESTGGSLHDGALPAISIDHAAWSESAPGSLPTNTCRSILVT